MVYSLTSELLYSYTSEVDYEQLVPIFSPTISQSNEKPK